MYTNICIFEYCDMRVQMKHYFVCYQTDQYQKMLGFSFLNAIHSPVQCLRLVSLLLLDSGQVLSVFLHQGE